MINHTPLQIHQETHLAVLYQFGQQIVEMNNSKWVKQIGVIILHHHSTLCSISY